MSEHVRSAWYADFFTELPNEFWRRAVPPEATTAEVDFVEERLGLAPGSRVVDVPCGSGRHSMWPQRHADLDAARLGRGRSLSSSS